MVGLLFEKTVSVEVVKAYEELRKLLFRNRCKIISEENPKSIKVEQGSLWRVTPKRVKKTVSFYFIPNGSETRVITNSSLTVDLMLVSLLGYVLAGIFAFMFQWLAVDLDAYIKGGGIIWKSLAFSYIDIKQPLFMVTLFKTLSTVSLIVLIYFILADIYVYLRKDSFAEKILGTLQKSLG